MEMCSMPAAANKTKAAGYGDQLSNCFERGFSNRWGSDRNFCYNTNKDN
jgi:hypothetical protein